MYVCAGSEGWINVVTLQREEKTRAHLVSTTKVLLCTSATCDNSVVCTYIPLGGTSNLPFESWCNFSHTPNAGKTLISLRNFSSASSSSSSAAAAGVQWRGVC